MNKGSVIAGRFEVIAEAASGAMGLVYRARDRTTGEEVALKLIRGTAEARVVRFEREATILASVHHENIVRHVDHGVTSDGKAYLAMEWLPGVTLAERLAREPLTLAESLAVVRRAAAGLSAAHRAGVVHRDVKPSNIFLVHGSPNDVRVIDFGLARKEGKRTITATGTALGTFSYISPEQALGARDVDARADVYSLGAVLFRCLTGRAPITATRASDLIASMLSRERTRPSEVNPAVPPALDDLVIAMMAREAADRPVDAGAVCDALDRLRLEEVRDSRPGAAGVIEHAERRAAAVLVLHDAADPPTLALALGELSERARALLGVPLRARDGRSAVAVRWDALEGATAMLRAARELAGGRISVGLALGRVVERESGVGGDAVDRAGTLAPSAPGRVTTDDGIALVADGRHGLPFSGRERELERARAAHARCLEESRAALVLVTAEAGLGRTRFLIEVGRALPAETSGTIDDAHLEPAAALDEVARSVRDGKGPYLWVAAVPSPPPPAWASIAEQEIRLGPLAQPVLERLARAALGPRAPDDVVTGIARLAGGSPLALRALARAGVQTPRETAPSSGRRRSISPPPLALERSAVPEIALSIGDRALGALSPDARRAARAASLFEDSFETAAVAAVLGGDAEPLLAELVERDVVDWRAEGGRGRFREPIVRESAYATLTARDRSVGHRIAAEWLESKDDARPTDVARHLDLGGLTARAMLWHRRAALEALEAGDAACALDHAERALRGAPPPPARGELSLLAARASAQTGATEKATELAEEAAALLLPGSTRFYEALELLITLCRATADTQAEARWRDRARAATPAPDAAAARDRCLR